MVSFYPRSREMARCDCLGGSFGTSCLAMGDDRIDDPVVLGIRRAEEEIAPHVMRNLLLWFARVFSVNLLEAPLEADYLARLNFDVGALSLEPTGHLIDQ